MRQCFADADFALDPALFYPHFVNQIQPCSDTIFNQVFFFPII